jgi:hypothetical protein
MPNVFLVAKFACPSTVSELARRVCRTVYLTMVDRDLLEAFLAIRGVATTISQRCKGGDERFYRCVARHSERPMRFAGIWVIGPPPPVLLTSGPCYAIVFLSV